MKLCVFPGDSLATLYKKGEIKPRYYNPENLFSEIHFFTFVDSDIEPSKIQIVAGDAKVFIHPVGKVKPLKLKKTIQKVTELIREIKPGVIRTFQATFQGYVAAKAAKQLGIPLVLSLHTNYDDLRNNMLKYKQYKQWAIYNYTKRFIEPFVVQNATKVICVYEFAAKYARKYGAKDVEIIYNKVYPEAFEKAKPAMKTKLPLVITVGRMINGKNQHVLIQAVEKLPVHLLIIGDGPNMQQNQNLIKELKIQDKVTIIPSVPNTKLPEYYKGAYLFALSIEYGGVAIPVLEAMCAQIPVIVSKPLEDGSEIANEVGIVVENNPTAFETAINQLLSDKKLYAQLVAKGNTKMREINGAKMEEKEAILYKKLI